MRQSELTAEIEAQAEQSYNQIDGKWREYLEVAKRFEHKAKAQDRLDLRHTIILAFADQQARNERLGKPDLSFYGMLRIASHCVADYWRQEKRQLTILSLNTEIEDSETGDTIELIETLADDKAIDLDIYDLYCLAGNQHTFCRQSGLIVLAYLVGNALRQA